MRNADAVRASLNQLRSALNEGDVLKSVLAARLVGVQLAEFGMLCVPLESFVRSPGYANLDLLHGTISRLEARLDQETMHEPPARNERTLDA